MRASKYVFTFAIVAILLAPILILVGAGIAPRGTFSSDTVQVFAFTVVQAFLSALLSLVVGVFGAYGLEAASVRFGRANGRFLEAICLLPNAAPVILLLLAVMKFAPNLRGLTGIIVIHALLNIGIVAATFLRLFKSKVAGLADLAYVEGSSRLRFFFKVVLPTLSGDLRRVFAFVFAICFTSFAVPLMIGGSQATTLEVLIWQTLRIDTDFSRAFGIALLQITSILALTLVLRRRRNEASQNVEARAASPLLSNIAGLPFVLLPSALIVVSLFAGPITGAKRFFANDALSTDFLSAVLGSFTVAIGTGVLVAVCLMAIAYADPKGWMRRLLVGYVAPSAAITGFAMLIVWRTFGFATYVKIMIALTLITVPAFYRLYWDAAIEGLSQQRIVAMSLGASNAFSFRKILFPQLARPAAFVAGLSALWAWGDFALSRVIAERDVTLGLMIQSLMNSYRFEIATFLIWVLIFGGAITFFMFQGVGRVFGQKSPG